VAILKATVPQIPKQHIGIHASGPSGFGWAPSVSEGCRDQLKALPLALRNAAIGGSNRSSRPPHSIQKLANSCLPGVTCGAPTVPISAS